MGKTLSQIDGSSELKSKIGRSLSKESRKTTPKIYKSKRLMNYDSSKQMQGSVEPTNIIIDTSLCKVSDKSSVEKKSNKRSSKPICNTTKNSMVKSINSKMSKSWKKEVKKDSSQNVILNTSVDKGEQVIITPIDDTTPNQQSATIINVLDTGISKTSPILSDTKSQKNPPVIEKDENSLDA